MSFTFEAPARSITATVLGPVPPRFETRPVLPSGRIAAPNGWLPVETYFTCLVCVLITAALSASPSATSRVLPSGETATRSGQDCCLGGTSGGKLSTGGAVEGGGTGITPSGVACPEL